MSYSAAEGKGEKKRSASPEAHRECPNYVLQTLINIRHCKIPNNLVIYYTSYICMHLTCTYRDLYCHLNHQTKGTRSTQTHSHYSVLALYQINQESTCILWRRTERQPWAAVLDNTLVCVFTNHVSAKRELLIWRLIHDVRLSWKLSGIFCRTRNLWWDSNLELFR